MSSKAFNRFCSDHYEPKTLVNSLKLVSEAILIEYTGSLSHFKQIGRSLSVMNYWPSCFARAGYYSTTDSLILQFLSSERSLSAGTIDCCRFSRPMTWLICSSRLNKLSLTSLDSSLRRAKKMGKICSLTWALSTRGQRARMFSARACLT